jgi:acyl carrier protein
MTNRDQTLDLVLDTFKRHLQVTQLGPDDDFFVHGGQSLIAFRVLTEIRRACDVAPAPEEFADLRTARAIAAWLDAQRLDEEHAIE